MFLRTLIFTVCCDRKQRPKVESTWCRRRSTYPLRKGTLLLKCSHVTARTNACLSATTPCWRLKLCTGLFFGDVLTKRAENLPSVPKDDLNVNQMLFIVELHYVKKCFHREKWKTWGINGEGDPDETILLTYPVHFYWFNILSAQESGEFHAKCKNARWLGSQHSVNKIDIYWEAHLHNIKNKIEK